MAAVVHVWFADIMLNGLAGVALCVVVSLFWMGLREKRKQRQHQRKREQQRKNHWGYQ